MVLVPTLRCKPSCAGGCLWRAAGTVASHTTFAAGVRMPRKPLCTLIHIWKCWWPGRMHKLSFKAVFVLVVFVRVFEPGSPFKMAVSKQLVGFSALLYFVAQAKLMCKPKFGLGRLVPIRWQWGESNSEYTKIALKLVSHLFKYHPFEYRVISKIQNVNFQWAVLLCYELYKLLITMVFTCLLF